MEARTRKCARECTVKVVLRARYMKNSLTSPVAWRVWSGRSRRICASAMRFSSG